MFIGLPDVGCYFKSCISPLLFRGLPCMVAAAFIAIGSEAAAQPSDANDPLLATYDGGTVHLRELEDFAKEMPLSMRVPFARRQGNWRTQMAGELSKSVELTSRAIEQGYHLDPAFLRSRDYFKNEFMAFVTLRNHVTNQMDVSLESQKAYYETHKADYWISPTVTLRLIRTASPDKLTSAQAELAAGKPFQEVELLYSEVSPRYRGRILGPFPDLSNRTAIPPPASVIEIASATPDGQTTGPVKVGPNYFIVQPQAHTPGRQQTREEVAEKIEEALRTRQYAILVPQLVDRIQKELGVTVDENLFANGTHPNDQLATIGATRLLRQEYSDLNGNVRGPAAPIAQLMPTKLKGFILPYMIGEWARKQRYHERDEAKRALYYYDLQHLSSRVSFELGDLIMPPLDDTALRKFFNDHIDDYRTSGGKEPRFEDNREMILDVMQQNRGQEQERRVSEAVLAKIHFKPVERPVVANITALEALMAAKDKLPADARLLEMAPVQIPTDASGGTPYADIGRAASWRISYATGSGVSELVVNGPAPMLNDSDDYTSIPAFARWESLWRFDTDSLKRHTIDKSLGDFIAKHDGRVRAAGIVEFSYSKDDPTSPTDCLIVYSATPSDNSSDGIRVHYSARDGEITRREVGQPEGKCPTCPAPDLPAAALLAINSTGTATLTNPTPNGKGEN